MFVAMMLVVMMFVVMMFVVISAASSASEAKLEHKADQFRTLAQARRVGSKRLSSLKLLADVHRVLISPDAASRN
jgi:hypothetical protein